MDIKEKSILEWSTLILSALCTLSACSLYAYTNDTFKEPFLFFDAGDFNSSAAKYKNILESTSEPWQESIILYNIGTAKLGCLINHLQTLQQKTAPLASLCDLTPDQWNDALITFQSIHATEKSLPLLDYRLQVNSSLARLLAAKAQSITLENNPDVSLEDYGNLVSLLQETGNDIAKIDLLRCVLSKAEGASLCSHSEEAHELQIELKQLSAHVLQNIHTYLLAHLPLEESSILLISGSNAALEHAKFLSHFAEGELSTKYLKLFLQQNNSWLPLWKKSEQSLRQEKERTKDTTFQNAFKGFSNGISLMEDHKYDASKQAFQESADELQSFIHLLFENKTVDEIIRTILLQYTLTLLNEPLQHLALQSLIEVQAFLEEPLKKIDNSKLSDFFNTSQKTLNQAVQLLESDQLVQAKIYTEFGRHQIKLLEWNLQTNRHSAKDTLKEMIELQEYALRLNYLRLRMEGQEKSNSHIDELVQKAQLETIQLTNLFYDAVIIQQREDLKKGDDKNSHIPWGDVLSSFEKGLKSAGQAKKLLSDSDLRQFSKVRIYQEKALSAWKEALADMQKKKKSDIKQQDQQQQPQANQSEENNRQQPLNNEPEKTKMQESGGSTLNDVLRSLQEMENDDRSQPHFKSNSASKDVERPW